MMYSIKGVVAEKTIKGIILEAGNVAYEVIASTTTKEAVTVGKETTLYTFLKLRHNEGDVELYGFSSKEEKQLFLLLTSVNKIGPKTALNILSATSLSKLQSAIGTKKIDFLTDIIGLSEKTATRIVIELSRKVQHVGESQDLESDLELEDALISLGFQKKDVHRVVDKLEGTPHNTQDRLKLALKMLHSR